jgi:hypothetical protein
VWRRAAWLLSVASIARAGRLRQSKFSLSPHPCGRAHTRFLGHVGWPDAACTQGPRHQNLEGTGRQLRIPATFKNIAPWRYRRYGCVRLLRARALLLHGRRRRGTWP